MSGKDVRPTEPHDMDHRDNDRNVRPGKAEALKDIMWRVTEETKVAISEAVAKELKKRP